MSLHKHHGADRVVKGALPGANAAMNITPMIDVLLVLIVIFMTALFDLRAIDVNLPPPQGADNVAPPNQIVVEYTSDRRLSINRQQVPHAELGEELRALFEGRIDKTMFVMAAGSLRYGEIVEVIDAAKGAGVTRVGIVTERMRRPANR
jgi:biopolymer transport protein ExbD